MGRAWDELGRRVPGAGPEVKWVSAFSLLPAHCCLTEAGALENHLGSFYNPRMLGPHSNQLNKNLEGWRPASTDCKSSPGGFHVLMRTIVLCPHSDPSGLCSAYLVSLFRILSLSYQLFCSLENRTRTRVPCQNGGRDEIHRKGFWPMQDLSPADSWLCLGLTPTPASL